MTTIDEQLDCDTSDLLTIHALFRRALTDAPVLVRGVLDGDAARTAAVAGHVREVAEGLRAGLVPTPRLTVLLDALAAWESSAAAEDGEIVGRVLEGVRDTLIDHFDDVGHAEAEIPPAESTVSRRAWGDPHVRGQASVPRDRGLHQLGWILEAIPLEDPAGWVRTNRPAPARAVWWVTGRRQLAAHH